MTFDHLRAKSGDCPDSPESVFLPGHLRDVLAAAKAVLLATGRDQLAALGLPGGLSDRLSRCVRLGAVLHDLGKANDHFQGMVWGVRTVPQGLRHEWVTVLLLDRLRDWLKTAPEVTDEDLAIAEWAVAGHHREEPPKPGELPRGTGPTLTVLAGHKDFGPALDVVAREFRPTADRPPLTDWTVQLDGSGTDWLDWTVTAGEVWRGWRRDKDSRRLAAAVKVCLIAADVSGSALPREVPDLARRAAWIPTSFDRRPTAAELTAIAERKLDGHPRREFQQTVADSTAPVTFVRAGCGSGKTIAAYLWAASRQPVRRVYFCYPTTGTATEGFRDYLHVPEAEADGADDAAVRGIRAKLFHGRSDVDLEVLITRGDGKNRHDEDADALARIESLDAWGTPVVSCTVDTVLGLMRNNRRGVFAWPALAGAAFVFDEIHAYDDLLFGMLLRLLTDLPGLPVLLMTASLSNGRKAALAAHLKKAGRDLCEVGGPETLEGLPRYEWDRRRVTAEEAATAAAGELDQPDGKVLWVSNTVGRAMAAARQLHCFCPDVYHSRFRYRDRVTQHGRVIERFKGAGRAVACCTQVAEMSLDLSATLLVTDLARCRPSFSGSAGSTAGPSR